MSSSSMLVAMRPARSALLLAALAALAATVLTAQPAHADERAECARAYEQAQRLQQSGENRRALDAAERCAQSTCPALLADECRPWVTQITKQLARVEVRVTGSDGCPAHDMTVEIDRVKHLASTEITVDAGVHEVRVVDPRTQRIVDRTINTTRGESQLVQLGFASEGTVCGAGDGTSHAGVPKAAAGLGIAGGALLVSGVVLGIVGAVKRGDLDACKPDCSVDRIDGVRSFFVAGDVVGGVGLVLLGTSAAIYFLGGSRGSRGSRGSAGSRVSAGSRGHAPANATSVRPFARGLEIRF